MWIMHEAGGSLKVKPFTVLPTCIFVQWSESYPQVARLQKHSLSCSLYNLALVPLSYIDLTHCGVVPLHGVTEICTGNGLLLGGTKPLAEPMLTNHRWGRLLAFTWEQLHREYWSYYCVYIVSLKITLLKSKSQLPGANELVCIISSTED